MKIFLVGLSDIGKSTIGIELAKKIDYKFFDFDMEVEEFFNTPISHIQSQFITEYSYRVHLSVVLKKIIEDNENNNYIVTLPPSGLRDCYLRILKKMDCVVIALHDLPENILERITFYDDDSNKIDKILTEKEKKLYLREIKKDNTYFNKTYKRTKYHINLDGASVEESVLEVEILIIEIDNIDKNNLFSSTWVK
ncbi:MAG: hypothetical protein K8R19_00055 [Methanosarcinales archaeon]|nr:hypothetical protein [Methanosarcinales archaeon]